MNDSIGQVAPDGTALHQIDLMSLPTAMGPMTVLAGDQWTFQYWHRDMLPAPGSNTTSAVTVTFN